MKIHKEVTKQYTRNHGGFLVFLLDDGRIQIRIRTSDYRIRIREAHSLRIRIQKTANYVTQVLEEILECKTQTSFCLLPTVSILNI
jgi:hypothetical protein